MSRVPDSDCEDKAADGMPPRFCKSKWKQVVTSCVAVAVLVLGYSIHEHFVVRPGAKLAFTETPAVRQVALTTAGATEPTAVHLVGRRSAFNAAAEAIRPAVLGIRVALGPETNGVPPVRRSGSAVVVDPRGYAVTCQHVVAGGEQIAARRFRETRWLPARVVAVEGDLALLQVRDSTPFPAATFADSSTVQVGDWVLAVGHPFGLGLTVTAGIVGRRHATLTLPGGQSYPDLLQTDAPINEGSSGGPLVNSAGQVVGVNAAIYAPTGIFAGAGFAIPGNRVRQFVEGVLGNRIAYAGSNGGSWGLSLTELTPGLSAQVGYSQSQGVVVSGVARGSAAYAARLTRGDIVTAIAGQPVPDLAAAERIHGRLAGARSVTLEVWRHGATFTVVLHPPSSPS